MPKKKNLGHYRDEIAELFVGKGLTVEQVAKKLDVSSDDVRDFVRRTKNTDGITLKEERKIRGESSGPGGILPEFSAQGERKSLLDKLIEDRQKTARLEATGYSLEIKGLGRRK